jgi:predicted XRE-type DNA-binding protein
MKERKEEHIEEMAATTDNMFADLGLPAMKINQIIEKRHLPQTQAAAILGIPQPKVSLIQQGKLRGFAWRNLQLTKPLGAAMLTS